jgi:hypothetical protein
MFASFGRSYRMFGDSLAVLRQDKTLLMFPILSGIFTIIAAVAFAFAEIVTGAVHLNQTAANGTEQITPLGYAFLFVWYFVSWGIVLFFNVAIIHCAKLRFDGKPATLSDGVNCAFSHAPKILMWALVSAFVGVILQVVADRNKIVGGIIKAVLGAAWAVSTFFIVPVMIYEDLSLWGSFKRSIELIYKSWGTAAVLDLGTGLFIFLLLLPAIIFPIAGAAIGPVGLYVGFAVMILWVLFVCALSSALNGIQRAALYNYASTGVVPNGMNAEVFQYAFKAK